MRACSNTNKHLQQNQNGQIVFVFGETYECCLTLESRQQCKKLEFHPYNESFKSWQNHCVKLSLRASLQFTEQKEATSVTTTSNPVCKAKCNNDRHLNSNVIRRIKEITRVWFYFEFYCVGMNILNFTCQDNMFEDLTLKLS